MAVFMTGGKDLKTELPSGYQKLRYLESTGTQHINTGIKPTNTTRVTMISSSTDTSSSNCFCFGSQERNQTTSQSFWLATWGVGYGAVVNTTDFTWYDGAIHAIDFGFGKVIIDGVVKFSTGDSAFSVGYDLYLFGTNDTDFINKFNGKIYHCQIYCDGILTRNFVPCVNPSDQIGMFDTVSQTFYPNVGTGAFIGG